MASGVALQFAAMSEESPQPPASKPPIPPGIRASDEDRERLASDLREHAVAGRLDTDELEDRLQAAYAARTTAELDELRHDLPATTRQVDRLSDRARRSHLTRRMVQESGSAVILFLVSTAVWVTSGAQSNFWPVWVLLLVLISLARNAWALYGPAADLDRGRARPRQPPPAPSRATQPPQRPAPSARRGQPSMLE